MKNLEKSHTRTERRQNVLTGSTINSSQYGILILLNGHHEQLVKTVRGSMIFKGSLLVIDIMIYRRSLENKWSLHSLLLFPFFCPVCEAHQISPWLQTPPCFFFNTTVCVGKEHLHLDSDVRHQRALSDAAYEYRGISFFLYFFFSRVWSRGLHSTADTIAALCSTLSCVGGRRSCLKTMQIRLVWWCCEPPLRSWAEVVWREGSQFCHCAVKQFYSFNLQMALSVLRHLRCLY